MFCSYIKNLIYNIVINKNILPQVFWVLKTTKNYIGKYIYSEEVQGIGFYLLESIKEELLQIIKAICTTKHIKLKVKANSTNLLK